MVYVKEILQARLADNVVDRKRLLDLIEGLRGDLGASEDLAAREGIQAALKDLYYEYGSLGQENAEIRLALKLICGGQSKKGKKKRASSLATGRLSSNSNSIDVALF